MTTCIEMCVPDLGAITEARVIEWLVKKGDKIELEQSVLTVESEKAALEIPATMAGTVQALKVNVGDIISTGTLILSLQTESEIADNVAASNQTTSASVYAGPGVRKLAREQGIDLNQVMPSGSNQRIVKDDVEQTIQTQQASTATRQAAPADSAGLGTDFSAFGEVIAQPLSYIKKASAGVLHRNWVTVPHVTQFDEADITELDGFRKQQQVNLTHLSSQEQMPIKLTLLPFVIKAIVYGLQRFPQFNASLSHDGQQLILKKYYHMGIAVDTPNGLVVPVMRDVNQKKLIQIAQELAEISQKARLGQLSAADRQGHSFSVSSLGNLGGGHFTPILNVPDVAILGVSKATIKPVYINNQFEPRLLLPLSLSYDHRVIDGAEAGRFMSTVVSGLRDMREWLL